MRQTTALLFGDNDYTLEIEKNIRSEYEEIYIFRLNEEGENSFDLGDNWDVLNAKVDIQKCIAFCILEDMAENIFLTISLRDTFKDLTIMALSEDEESTNKLVLAGATRVLPTIETTANIIVDILEKPIVTEVLHNILYEQSSLKIAQIQVQNENIFDEKHPINIQWSKDYGIIIISIIHENMQSEFIYTSKKKNQSIKNGDTFIVVGYTKDIETFEKLVGKKSDEN